MSDKHEFVKSKDYRDCCRICEYGKKNPIHNPNPTEKSMIQKKKIMLHKTKEHATDVIPNPIVESWEESFDEKWIQKLPEGFKDKNYAMNPHSIKQFISTQIQQAEERGAMKAYKMFLKTINEAKNKFPGRKEFELVVDIRDLEKNLASLKEEK